MRRLSLATLIAGVAYSTPIFANTPETDRRRDGAAKEQSSGSAGENLARPIRTSGAKTQAGDRPVMTRLIFMMLFGAVVAAAPAHATSDTAKPADTAGGSATAPAPAPTVGDQAREGPDDDVKAACNPRRPSCRKRQALDARRMENATNDD